VLPEQIWNITAAASQLVCYVQLRACKVTYNTFGDKSFAAAGPRVVNSPPVHLRNEDITGTHNSFSRELKTYWF